MNGEREISDEKFGAPSLFIVGNEGRESAKKTFERCGVQLRIPMNPKCESLNASVSSAIVLFIGVSAIRAPSKEMDNLNLVVHPWKDYELIDSGDNRKLERYGEFIIIRPETQAVWKPGKPDEWKKAKAEFRWFEGKGVWSKKDMPERWELSWEDVRFSVMLTSFKHTGIFPEQVPNWEWLKKKTLALKAPQVLNLFGYTGIATIVAAKNGAYVTHVDASKQANDWTKENARLSEIPEDKIRYMLGGGLKFAEREVRRKKFMTESFSIRRLSAEARRRSLENRGGLTPVIGAGEETSFSEERRFSDFERLRRDTRPNLFPSGSKLF